MLVFNFYYTEIGVCSQRILNRGFADYFLPDNDSIATARTARFLTISLS